MSIDRWVVPLVHAASSVSLCCVFYHMCTYLFLVLILDEMHFLKIRAEIKGRKKAQMHTIEGLTCK